MRVVLTFLLLFLLIGCNIKYNIPFHTEDDKFPQQVSLQKSFFVLDSQILANKIPKKISLNKIFFLSTKNMRVKGKSNYYHMVLSEDKMENISGKFNSSFIKLASEIGKEHNFDVEDLLWTDKKLTHLYPSTNFDPEYVQLDDLIEFSDMNENNIVILPLIRYYDNQVKEWGWRYINQYVLTVAFYIFDKNQIYYARSANLSKVAYIENSINPKDTQFLQSEWDYLVYEALRPLIEKGVELEIVGREN